ncbi:MAG: trypsin-like peptidase domain-containing protein, partial [Phycisphaeraceae bacterium]
TLVQNITHAQSSTRIELTRNSLEESPFLAQLSESLRRVSEVVKPSVVHIAVSGRPDAGPRMPGRGNPFEGTPWEEFFERRMPDGGDDGDFDEYNAPRLFGNGSGWVYDEKGHIVTNYHVIRGAEEISVRFVDGEEVKAEVVGQDEATDIAVLKIESDKVQPAAIADEPVAQGDLVFAFGSPFRFDFSMSMGIVSAKGRSLGIVGRQTNRGTMIPGFEDFIQTDAAVNPGNSGGPLTNIYGQVVGMNTAIATRTGSNSGLGFAIPAGMITDVVDQIVNQGNVARGFLGIRLPSQDLTPEMAESFGFEGKGVLVADAISGSPAAEAGLEPGDIITEINGEKIESIRELRFMVAGMPPGTTVDVAYFRQGKGEQTTEVTLGRLPGSVDASPERGSDDTAQADGEGMNTLKKLGFNSLETFTEELAEELNREPIEGVLIESVRRGSFAAAEGIVPGMVITHVMGQRVEDLDDLADEMEDVDPTRGVRMRVAVWDNASEDYLSTFVLVKLPKR